MLLVVMQCQNVIPIIEEDQAPFCRDQEPKSGGDVPLELIGKYTISFIFTFSTFQYYYNSFALLVQMSKNKPKFELCRFPANFFFNPSACNTNVVSFNYFLNG